MQVVKAVVSIFIPLDDINTVAGYYTLLSQGQVASNEELLQSQVYQVAAAFGPNAIGRIDSIDEVEL